MPFHKRSQQVLGRVTAEVPSYHFEGQFSLGREILFFLILGLWGEMRQRSPIITTVANRLTNLNGNFSDQNPKDLRNFPKFFELKKNGGGEW